MSNKSAWKPALALAGLAALLVYILACTSFSPDDSKVLYPTIDPQSGAIGVAVYDRASRKSQLVFVPVIQNSSRSKVEDRVLLRPQWLSNGRDILVAWADTYKPGFKADDKLDVAVLPYDRNDPIRQFHLEGLNDSSSLMLQPIPVVGKFLFLTGQSNEVIRLDLTTGQVHQEKSSNEICFLPTPRGDSIFYILPKSGEKMECGLMDPATMARTPIPFQIKDNDSDGFPILSRDLKRLARSVTVGERQGFRLVEPGKGEKTLFLPSASGNTALGNAQFSPKGDILYVAFMDSGEGTNDTSFGFMEIPVNGNAVRQTTVLTCAPGCDKGDVLLFPIEVSHNGKTIAASSTYMKSENFLRPEDRGLFLVDLTHAKRKITKVPVPQAPRK